MYYFIINPNSRSNAGLAIWDRIQEYLQKNEIKYQYKMTEFSGHARELASKWSHEFEEDTIIVLGGDGTINEVINGLQDFSSISLAYIPTGSSNDFARSMKISTNPIEALEHILFYAEERFLDVGMVSDGDDSQLFMVSSGIGFDAAVCKDAVQSSIKNFLNRIHLGKLTYFSIALKKLITSKRTSGQIQIDEHTFPLHKLIFTAAQNHPFEGGGFCFCPNAKPDDQLLNFIFADHMSKFKVLCALPCAMRGTHDRFKGIHIGIFHEMDLQLNHPLPVHTDGEYWGEHSHVHFSLCDRKLKFLI